LKLIDKILRYWRVSVALKQLPKNINAVFDIGCDDGYLLKKIDDNRIRLDGCDPRLSKDLKILNSMLLKGFFPAVMDDVKESIQYDAIFSLAVFEHFIESDLTRSSHQIAEMLKDSGRLIVTVPHPFVDHILNILMALKLIDGQALEEHHGFNPDSLVEILSKGLLLKSRRKFQLGLNNVFIFEKNLKNKT